MLPGMNAIGLLAAGAGGAVEVEFLDYKTSAANSTFYNFTGYGLGAAHVGKLAVACVSTFNGNGGEIPGDVTIGGASATRLAGLATSGADVFAGVYSLIVPASPDDEIFVGFSNTQAACSAGLYILGGADPAAHDTGHNLSNTSTASLSVTLDVLAGGAVIFVGNVRQYQAQTLSNGLVKVVDQTLDGGFGGVAIGSKLITLDALGETFTSTPAASEPMVVSAASFKAA